MPSFQSLPHEIFLYTLFPFLENQSIFSIYRTCKYYKKNIDANVMYDLKHIYFMSVIIDDVSSSYKSFFIGRSLSSLQQIITNYAITHVHRGESGIRNYTITKIKFGSHINVSNITCKPVKNFSSFKKKQFPDLYGTHNYMLCHTFVNKIFNFVYIIKPIKNIQQCPLKNAVDILALSLIDTVIISYE